MCWKYSSRKASASSGAFGNLRALPLRKTRTLPEIRRRIGDAAGIEIDDPGATRRHVHLSHVEVAVDERRARCAYACSRRTASVRISSTAPRSSGTTIAQHLRARMAAPQMILHAEGVAPRTGVRCSLASDAAIWRSAVSAAGGSESSSSPARRRSPPAGGATIAAGRPRPRESRCASAASRSKPCSHKRRIRSVTASPGSAL